MNDLAAIPFRILLLAGSPENEPTILSSLKQAGLDAVIQWVNNEVDFIAALAQAPDLILFDRSIKQFNALQIVKEKQMAMPFIVIAETADEDQALEALQHGADDCVTKDQLTRLGFTVRRALELKRLRASEENYRTIFENATVAIWEEDFSEVKAELDGLRVNGVNDFRKHINEHPEFLQQAVKLVKIREANTAMLRLYNTTDKTDVLGSLDRFISAASFEEELIAFAEGQAYFEREIYGETRQGNHLDLLLTITYYQDTAGRYKALAHLTDITARKQAESKLRGQNEYLALLNEVNRAILLPSDYEATMRALAVNLKQIIHADDCYLMRWDEEQQTTIPVVTTAILDFPFTEVGTVRELSVTASILDVGHVIAIEDVFNTPYVDIEIAKKYPARSIVGIPLIAGNQKLGAAIIAFNSSHSFTQEELDRAEQAGNQIALALQYFQQGVDVQQRLKESNALAQIGRSLSATEHTGTSKVLQLIVNSARDLIPQAEESVIHLLDLEEQVLIAQAVSGIFDEDHALSRVQMKLGEGVAGQVIREGTTINIGDIENDSRFIRTASQPEFRSLLVAPVQSGGQQIGTISVQSAKKHAFTTQDAELLNALGIQAAIAIENTRLFETTQQQLKEVDALYKTSQGLAASLDTDQLIKDIVLLLHQNFGYYFVQIYTVDAANGELILKSESGRVGDRLLGEGFRIPRGIGIISHVAETGEAFVTNNVNAVVFYYHNPLLPDTQSEMTVPIKVDGKVVGVLDIQHTPPNRFTNDELQLMMAVADQLAVALQKANLYKDLQIALQQEKTVRSQLIQSERLALVGRLLASVSHELNNPLQAIQNALFLLKDEKTLSSQAGQDLDIILSEAERMTALIERLRSAYRPVRIKDFRAVELNNLIEDVYALISTHMRQKEIAFEFFPHPNLPNVSGLSDQIRQVVLNLFLNAIEVMKPGGRLTVLTRGLLQQNEVLLTVKDTGQGIDPEILPQIFEPFITNKQTGTGLGLTITHDIIQQHHGRITADNDPQGGAIFNIWLPIHEAGSV